MKNFFERNTRGVLKVYGKKSINYHKNTKMIELEDDLHTIFHSTQELIKNEDFESAHKSFLKAIEISKELKNGEFEENAILGVADLYHSTKEYQKTIDFLLQNLPKFESSKNQENYKKACKFLASSYKLSYRWKESEKYFQEALNLATEESEKIYLLENLGESLLFNQNYQEATKIYEYFYNIYEKTEDNFGKTKIIQNLSLSLVRTGRRKEGEQKLEELIKSLTSIKDYDGVYRVKSFIKTHIHTDEQKEFFKLRKKLIEAISVENIEEIYQKCLKITEIHPELKDFLDLSYVIKLIKFHQFKKVDHIINEMKHNDCIHLTDYLYGNMYLYQKDYQKASFFLKQALFYYQIEDSIKVDLMTDLGLCYSLLRDFEKADEYLDHAYGLAQKLNHDFDFHSIVLNEILKGNFENAYEVLRLSSKNPNDDTNSDTFTLEILSFDFKDENLIKHYQNAEINSRLQYIDEAIQDYENMIKYLPDSECLYYVHRKISILYTMKGMEYEGIVKFSNDIFSKANQFFREKDYESSKNYYGLCLIIARDLKNIRLIVQCLRNLSNLYYALGDSENAKFILREAEKIDENKSN